MIDFQQIRFLIHERSTGQTSSLCGSGRFLLWPQPGRFCWCLIWWCSSFFGWSSTTSSSPTIQNIQMGTSNPTSSVEWILSKSLAILEVQKLSIQLLYFVMQCKLLLLDVVVLLLMLVVVFIIITIFCFCFVCCYLHCNFVHYIHSPFHSSQSFCT